MHLQDVRTIDFAPLKKVMPQIEALISGARPPKTTGQELFLNIVEHLDEGDDQVLLCALAWYYFHKQPLIIADARLPETLSEFPRDALEALRTSRSADIQSAWGALEKNYQDLIATLRRLNIKQPGDLSSEEANLIALLDGRQRYSIDRIFELADELPSEQWEAAWALSRVLKRQEMLESGAIIRELNYKIESIESFTGSREDQEKMSPYYRG